MKLKYATHRYWKITALTLLCWTFLAILFAPQTYLINLSSPTPLGIGRALAANFILFYLWAVLTPFVLWLGQKFSIARLNLVRNLTVHLVFCLFFAVIHIFLLLNANTLFLYWVKEYRLPVSLPGLLVGFGATNVMIYWGIIAVSQAITYFRKFQEREKQLTEAQLQVLKTQLQPHFLFNTINAISELVYEEPEKADKTLGQLSDLLRISLKGGKVQEIPLKDEMDFLEKYIEIQQTLLQHRLTVKLDIPADTLDAGVPNMILQPLAENAIRHGIAPSLKGGNLEIKARRQNKTLLLTVRDDGIGLNSNKEILNGGGIGLFNTRTRLEQLYGNAQRFEMIEPEEGGVAVNIAIPFREIKSADED